jgi:hypothetical protein
MDARTGQNQGDWIMFSKNAKCLVALMFACLSCCAQQQPESVVQTIQPGDSTLTCQQIEGQIAQLNQVAYNASPDNDIMLANTATGVQTIANGAAQLIGGTAIFGALPVVGGAMNTVAALAGNSLAASARKHATTVAAALQREQYLLGIYRERNCAASQITRSAAK